MQFLLVQNGHQTHGWTLIGSDANGLGILEWDECAARLQPLVDQNKLKTTPNFRNRKIPRIDCNTRSCPGDEKISFKKKFPGNLQKMFVNNEKFQKPIT